MNSGIIKEDFSQRLALHARVPCWLQAAFTAGMSCK